MLRTQRAAMMVAAGALVVGALGAASAEATVNATASADPTPLRSWNLDGRVFASVIIGDTVYVGGNFTKATSPQGEIVTRRRLAAFDLDSGDLVRSFRVNANGTVRALVTDGDTIWVGGNFRWIGGHHHVRLASLDPETGAVSAQFSPSASKNVFALDLRAGRLFIGGNFTSLSGTHRNRAGSVDPVTGALDTRFNPSANGPVWAIRANPDASLVYLAGKFGRLGVTDRAGVGSVDGTTGRVRGPRLDLAARPTRGLDMNPSGTLLYGAGGSGTNAMAAWDTSSGARLWRQIADGDIQAVRYYDGDVYFGFHDGYHGNKSLKLLVADADTGTLDTSFMPTFNNFWGVYSIAANDSHVVAGGDFSRVNGVPAEGLAIFRRDATSSPPNNVLVDGDTAWQYFDQGSVPGANWAQPGFDDSAWPSGQPQFGYGDGDETTTVSYGPRGNDRYITTYFRTTFDLADPSTPLRLGLLADDGAVVYVNGAEVARDNMPTGSIGFSTRAASGRWGRAEDEVRSFSIPSNALTSGTNTISV
ncbi:MAG: hypothetical protein L0K86_24875 [Actinomycetia bacterium]|nr:hypothetical protein [Actinomycetes bacterium]